MYATYCIHYITVDILSIECKEDLGDKSQFRKENVSQQDETFLVYSADIFFLQFH